MNTKSSLSLHLARFSWVGLILLTFIWDGLFSPLNTGLGLVIIKLLPLCLPLLSILSGRLYTYQYASMLVLLYLGESIMRLFDSNIMSRVFALMELLLSLLFFLSCLAYVRQSKRLS